MTWELTTEEKFIIPSNEELLPLICRSKYVVLGRLGACDGATNITYLILFYLIYDKIKNCKIIKYLYKSNYILERR